MRSDQKRSVCTIEVRRLEWRHRGCFSLLIDRDSGNTIARILRDPDGTHTAEVIEAGGETSIHGDDDSATRWVMERV